MATNQVAEEIIQEFEYAKSQRGNWESHWQEIAERVIPSQSRSFTSMGKPMTQGEKRTEFIFDSTASIALNRFAAILDSLLTPMNATWHRLKASIPELNKDKQVQQYFEEVNRRLFKYRYASTANFTSQNQQNFKSIGAFGTGCMFIDKLYRGVGLRYKSVHLGEVYFLENHQGLVDRVIRHFSLTARQANLKWGNKLPKEIMDAAKTSPNQEFYFLHCVKPRYDYDLARLDFMGMPWASYYVAMNGAQVIEEEGYNTFPYAISRYEQAPGETYGRGPAMDCLPAIKTLNEEKKALLKQAHRVLDPVLLMYDDGVLDGFSMKPGALNAGGVSADGRALVQTLPTGNIMIGKDVMDDERLVINDSFLVNLFQILVETTQMTATEVAERAREKGILIAPVLGRHQAESQGPMIERELDLLSMQGLLPPMPDILIEAGAEYKVEYESPLSRTQRMEEATGLMRTIESILAITNVTQNPAPLDHFDWDIIVPELSSIQGVPAKWMRSLDDVQAIREGRAEEMQQQQRIEAAPGNAAMINAASKVRAA